MALDLSDCKFHGPALPGPFVKLELEAELNKRKLLTKETGAEAKTVKQRWDSYRRKLGKLSGQAGAQRVLNHVIEPIVDLLGYERLERQDKVKTREALEDGGWLLSSADGAVLRVWGVELDTDLDAPNRRGRAYRFSPSRVAQRVLLEKGERVGLLTDGVELRLLICDPARPDSHLVVVLERSDGWRGRRAVPDSFRLLRALASPAGVAAIPELTEKARLSQTRVTAELRLQARQAIEGFVQELLDHPANAPALAPRVAAAPQDLAQTLWRESLIMVYRLLFVLKLESSSDPARAFSFASMSLWRNTYSPNVALGRYVEAYRDRGADTGQLLEHGLRALFRMFAHGLDASGLKISPLGGMLFGEGTTPTLDNLAWGERAVAHLLDRLLWTSGGKKGARLRVHYGSLDVEDLGRVYEALLELEPGLSCEPMARLRRSKLEVVVPAAQADPYRGVARRGAKKSKVELVEDIAPGRFYLRVGLGRKSTGSYYTPHPFVRFLCQETIVPQVTERSPTDDPQPAKILALNVLDPAMGSGHFLVEACRQLGEHLYEACRLCDELADRAEDQARAAKTAEARERGMARAMELRRRVEDLPDPNDALVAYLPSRVAEGGDAGLSQHKALALCRRLVAVHCLYGVDKNPLAVELAKLSLWLESYAEGLPLTFLDHRLVCGDSLTGPFFEQLLTYPKSGAPIEGLLAGDLGDRLRSRLDKALTEVRALEESVGKDVADLERKRAAKQRLDATLADFQQLARAWSSAVMLGSEADDGAYLALVQAVASGKAADGRTGSVVTPAADAVAYEFTFPEVFELSASAADRRGFDAVIGNPPWDEIQPLAKEFFASYDLRVLDAPTRLEREEVEERLLAEPRVAESHAAYLREFDEMKRIVARSYLHVNRQAHGAPSGASTDVWQMFGERSVALLSMGSRLGVVLPSSFHANQSATGIRELFLSSAPLQCCFSFENRAKLFDIDSRLKFATIVATKGAPRGQPFSCAFYLHDLSWLFRDEQPLEYTEELVRKTGGDYLSFLELQSEGAARVAARCYSKAELFGGHAAAVGISLGRELHMTDDNKRFTPVRDVLDPDVEDPREPNVAERLRAAGYLPLHEGKTFHQFDDRWGDPPRYLIHRDNVVDKPAWLQASRYYRLAFRDVASSTNERTGIFSLLPPGVLCGNKAPCDRKPAERPTAPCLELLAIANTFAFDFSLRLKVAATVNLFILDGCPVPARESESLQRLLVHGSLRLVCNHAGYAQLWAEQLGTLWREEAAAETWPVLAGQTARWSVRVALDAAIADAYGLSREHYAHVLSTFSHKSYSVAPELCLAVFDELKALGLDAFCRKHDPYWDIPVNDRLPEPVIDLPTSASATTARRRGGKKRERQPDLT